jgi:hypothetical protein
MPTFADLLSAWPERDWSVSVNPGTPIEVSLSGEQIRMLVAAIADRPAEQPPGPAEPARLQNEVPEPPGPPSPFQAEAPPQAEPFLRPEAPPSPATGEFDAGSRRPDAPGEPDPANPPPGPWTLMQKVVPHDQVAWYLDQAYDRVAGFVHRVQDVIDLGTPNRLYESLGLLREDSPFAPDDAEVHIIRWPAYRAGLYRTPFGGQAEEALRSWGEGGWVVEAPPFAGDGFAPGSGGSIREYKVDSLRVPHGTEMYAVGSDSSERFVARYDADRMVWGDSE